MAAARRSTSSRKSAVHYRSGLEAPDLLNAFRPAEGDPRCGHIIPMLAGRELLTVDEGTILYHLGMLMPGKWLELGSDAAWSAAHLASACCDVVSVDTLHADVELRPRTMARLRDAQVRERVALLAIDPATVEFGQDFFAGVLCEPQYVKAACAMTEIVVFRGSSPGAEEAMRAADEAGLTKRQVYMTPHLLVVRWREQAVFIPPVHLGDPTVNWRTYSRTAYAMAGAR